jgi:hypothetical protein
MYALALYAGELNSCVHFFPCHTCAEMEAYFKFGALLGKSFNITVKFIIFALVKTINLSYIKLECFYTGKD